MILPHDAWVMSRLLCGAGVDGPQLEKVGDQFRRMATRLSALDLPQRQPAFELMLLGSAGQADEIVDAIASASFEEPPAEAESKRPANLGDIRRIMSREQWLWEGWLPKSRISGISAGEGVGKTQLAMDLARGIWFGDPWPDGQSPTLPPETPTLWVCSDGQQDDIVSTAERLNMPDHSIFFNTTPDDPYGGTSIDSEESRRMLEDSIAETRPGLVFIDSLTYATSKDLCVANQVKDLMTPIRDISQKMQTTIVPLLHVSKDGQALGKRIKGIARTILQLEALDPESTNRLRLSVAKSYAKKPVALGVTITDKGNQYDSTPPTAPQPGKVGRPPESREEAVEFILGSLRKQQKPLGASALCGDWQEAGKSKNAFWRARDFLVEESRISCSGSPLILQLIAGEGDSLGSVP